jgi:putative hydrolase of the HAD superfamily
MKDFRHIENWIFDLDNTLYPASCRLFDQMHERMGEYVMRHFRVEYGEAKRIQKALFHKNGTTLRGLIVEHNHAPEGFLDYVHDIDYTPVRYDPALIAALERLPGRKLVFTNGTTAHARRVMERLGVAEAFHGVFDIVDSAHIPKPQRTPYEKFLKDHDVDARTSAMFEDIARNLEVPHEMGMVTVLVASEDNEDAKLLNGSQPLPHVDHVTDDLAAFLAALNLGD